MSLKIIKKLKKGVENFGNFSEYLLNQTLGGGETCLKSFILMSNACIKQLLNICIYLYYIHLFE